MTPRALRLAIIAALVAVAAGYFLTSRHGAEQSAVPPLPAPPAVPSAPPAPPVPAAPEASPAIPAVPPAASLPSPPSEPPSAARPAPAAAARLKVSGNYADDWMKICGPIKGEAQKGCTAKLNAAYGRAEDKPVPPAGQ